MKNLHQQISKASHKYTWPAKYLQAIVCPLCTQKKYSKKYATYYPRIVQCVTCDLIYTNPQLKNKYMRHLYSEEYFQNNHSSLLGYSDYVFDQDNILKTFNKRLKKIETIIKPGKLLDVGCATGFFMKCAKKRGWQVEGVEISEFAASFAQKKYGFKIHVGDILQVNLPANTYDLITLWDVIEHVTNPIAVIEKLQQSLKKDGLLVFSTPDVASIPAKLTKHKWVGYKLCDEHLTYFSKETASLLLAKSGFFLLNSEHVGKYVSFSLFRNRVGLYNTFISALLRGIEVLLPKNFSFYVNPFDIICVYAKKE